MPRSTRSRTPGKDDDKRKLLTSLKPADFPSLVADILYFSKGHRSVRIMDGPGDGCRDIQSSDKDQTDVITQCKCFANPRKAVTSPDANELIVALTKFGRKRGVLATTGRFTPQLKREFTDNFPHLHLDWMDGSDIVDEVLSNPLLHRAWVIGLSVGRETVYVKIPFVVRRAATDSSVQLEDVVLNSDLSVEHACLVDVGTLERFRPPEAVDWTESIGPQIWAAGLLSRHPPDLHAIENLHEEAMRLLFAQPSEVLTIRLGTPYLVPTKNPDFEKGIRLPGFTPKSYVLRPGKTPVPEHEFLTVCVEGWEFPENISMAEADWANWQTADNQRWCHIGVYTPPHPNTNNAHLARMIGASRRRDFQATGAIFVTATVDVCQQLTAVCNVQPDHRFENGPGGGVLGWLFSNEETRNNDRETVLAALKTTPKAKQLSFEDAIEISTRTDDPLIPVPGWDAYYPANLVHDYERSPSPFYLNKRTCNFVEFWKLPCDVPTAQPALDALNLETPEGWRFSFRAKNDWPIYTPQALFEGRRPVATFAMVSVIAPWDLAQSATEVVAANTSRADELLKMIGTRLQEQWPGACCATAELWGEVSLPAAAYVQTEEGWVQDPWQPEPIEEGDD